MKVMKRKLIGLFICLILVATIPLAAGVDVAEDDHTETNDGFFGYTVIRGFVLNPKMVGNFLNFRAIRLHYTEFTGMETATGVLRGVKCSVRESDWNPISVDREINFGPLGTFTWIFGIYKGSIKEC